MTARTDGTGLRGVSEAAADAWERAEARAEAAEQEAAQLAEHLREAREEIEGLREAQAALEERATEAERSVLLAHTHLDSLAAPTHVRYSQGGTTVTRPMLVSERIDAAIAAQTTEARHE